MRRLRIGPRKGAQVATKEGDVEVIREGLTFSRYFTTEGRHPFDDVEWETRDAVIPNFKEGGFAFEQRDVEFPISWSQNATNIVAQKYFRGTLGTPQRESSVRQLTGRVVDTIRVLGRAQRLLRDRARRASLRGGAHTLDGQSEGRVQLPGLVQRRRAGHASAVQRVLHPRGRGPHVLDPQLVRRGRHDLQRRLRIGHQPVADPLVEGVARRWRHGVGSRLVHARRRRFGRHDQVGWQDPSSGQDGDPEHRPPGYPRLHLVQGGRGAQGARAAGRRVRHGPRRSGRLFHPVSEREQLGAGDRRVHARVRAGPGLEAQGRADAARRSTPCAPAS